MSNDCSDDEDFSSNRHARQLTESRPSHRALHHHDRDDDEMDDDVNVARYQHQPSTSASNYDDTNDPRLRRLKAARAEE